MIFFVAETSMSSTSPPIFSTTISCCSSSWRTRSGLASGLSILLIATMIGALAALGVADRLDRLLLDAVIGGDHQHDDVGDVGAARAHRGKGLVARRVDEGDPLAALQDDLIGADMLRDAAGLAGGHVGLAQRVEQRGLAVVDMAHDGDDRRPRLQRFRRILVALEPDLDIGFRRRG